MIVSEENNDRQKCKKENVDCHYYLLKYLLTIVSLTSASILLSIKSHKL